MSFGYLDQYGILHIVDRKEDAEKYAHSKIVTTDIPNGAGYPEDKDGDHIIVYTTQNKYKVSEIEYALSDLAVNYPAVDALVKEIMA